MADRMSSWDYSELERLSRKAANDELVNNDNENNYQYLQGVEMFASRRK